MLFRKLIFNKVYFNNFYVFLGEIAYDSGELYVDHENYGRSITTQLPKIM